MTFYCLIGQEMLNLVTNCCKLLKVNQAAERAVSSTDGERLTISDLESRGMPGLYIICSENKSTDCTVICTFGFAYAQ